MRPASPESRRAARRALEWCRALAEHSERADGLYRPFGSAALERAARQVGHWMREAGLEVRRDALGSVIGRLPGAAPDAPVLMIGSHLDTVPSGGRFDGALGVALPVALCEPLPRGVLPYHLDVVGFLAEEGVRFGVGCLSSRGMIGDLGTHHLELRDPEGVTLAEALAVHGGDPEAVTAAAPTSPAPAAFLELHIEQGPVLEQRGIPVGVVSGVVGQSRGTVRFLGQAGHAGTTPMPGRSDALVAAAAFILGMERLALETPGLVATVGRVEVHPNACNVIPGEVALNLDVRHPLDAPRLQAVRRLVATAEEEARRRGLRCEWHLNGQRAAVTCDPELRRRLAEAVSLAGHAALQLPSLAGHDAMVMARVAPVGMLFIRSPGGLSHHPDEDVREEDVAVAAEVLVRYLGALPHPGVARQTEAAPCAPRA